MRENPKPYELFRHFKGNLYQIITLATDSEDGTRKVVYQALYDDYRVYVRDLEMFMSRVDKEKYPQAEQEYRFERVQSANIISRTSHVAGEEISGAAMDTQAATADEREELILDPAVAEYLDAAGTEERLNILTSVHHRITQEMLTTMAVASDIELEEVSLEEQYQSLKNCLLTKQKFEKVRLY